MHVLILLILLFLSADKPVEKQNPANAKNNSPTADQAKPSPTATPSPSPQQPNAQDKSNDGGTPSNGRTYKIEVEKTPPDYWMRAYVIINLFIAAAGVTSIFLIKHQRDVMKDQLQAMRDQLTEMKLARQHDRSMAKLEYRAWIQFESIKHQTADKGEFKVIVGLGNAGRTPAKNIKVKWVVESRPGKNPDFDYSPDLGITARPVFPPKAILMLPITTNYGLTRQLWSAIEQGKRSIFAHGKVTYEDVFGDHHWMTFCQEFSTELNRFAIYDEHNETDD
jgi:hypothetical protein